MKERRTNAIVAALLFLVLGLGLAFAQESTRTSELGFWSDYTSEPATQVISGKTFYSITTAEELAWFAALTNTNEKNNANKYTGKNAILLADIDLSGKIWVPIAAGKGDGIFQGTFDGNHHTITGLTIDGLRVAYETENIYCKEHENKPLCNGQNIGFFGSSKGIIKNLSLEIADIQAANSEGLTMQMGKPISVGTLIGWQNGGTVDGIYVSGHINTSGSGQGVGGIVGNAAQGTISNSVSDVSIYASGDNVFIGGVAGYTKGSVNVNSCVYSGEHIVNDGHNGAVGGIVGNSTSANLNATNSYYDTDMFGDKGVGTGSVNANNKPTGVEELNSEQVACGMNGGTWDANTELCSNKKTDEWDVGISELSRNGSDGYKITFVVNADDAVFPANAVTSKLVAKGTSITADGISLPTREGYKFAGWAVTSDAVDPSADLGSATERKTIYAVWYEKFPVTFDAGTGSFPHGAPDPLYVAKGDLISLDIDIPVKSADGAQKYSFAGWSTSSQEIIFEADADIVGLWNFDEDRVSGPTAFYAAWTKAEVYTVKFNANGHGKTEWDQVNVSRDEHLATPPLTADPGYQYDGWYTESTFDNEFDFENTLIEQNYELFAKWSAILYQINYELNGGSAPSPNNPSTYTIEDQFELLEPSRTCYDFVEWYDSDNNYVVGVTKGTIGEINLFARWKQQTKVINYSTGNIIQATASPHEYPCGESVTLSDTIKAFSRPGYTQDGWTTSIGGSVVLAPMSSYTGTENVTFYAHWSLNAYSINYELDGGEFDTPAVSTYTINDAVTLAVPTKSGSKFDGWYDNAGFEGDAVTEVPLGSTGDKTLYAKWLEYPVLIASYGAIEIYENEDGTTAAVINATSSETIPTITDVEVSSVTFNRNFTTGVKSTIVLPFSISVDNVHGGTFYQIAKMFKTNGKWTVGISEIEKNEGNTLSANTPYIFIASATNLTFDVTQESPVTLNTTTMHNVSIGVYEDADASTPIEANVWTFKGTYDYKVFGNMEELGRAYGFSGEAKDNISVGTFVKGGSGATIRPLRAYLVYEGSQSSSKTASLNYGSAFDELPDEVDVVVLGEQGNITERGVLNTVTGQVRMDRWYDLQGRKLNGKPTVKGTYYHNGKCVTIR